MNKIFIDTDIEEATIEKMRTGCFYRAFDLIAFLKTMREKGMEPMAFKFEKDSNNVEILYTDNE